MTNATTTNEDLGIADELGIQYGDFVTVTIGGRTISGSVRDFSEDGDAIQIDGCDGLIFLEGADVSID